MMYDDDERAPLTKGLYEHPSEPYVPSFAIMKQLYDEQKEAMYCHDDTDDDYFSESEFELAVEHYHEKECESESESENESESESESDTESTFDDSFVYKNVYYV